MKKVYGEVEVIRLIVTYFATPRALKRAEEKESKWFKVLNGNFL